MLLEMRPPFLRTFLPLALIAAAAAATAACERKSEGVVQVLVIGGEPRLVDPRTDRLDVAEAVLLGNAAQGLVRFDARGQIEPGLAETWNVSDDGLSYIFRLANAEWPNGRKITAEQIARMLRRRIGESSAAALRDSFGAVEEIVAMTDRVIEIRLGQPRPHLLQLLAHPEMGLVFEGQGSGPFAMNRAEGGEQGVRLQREVAAPDEDEPEQDLLELAGATAEQAVSAFVRGEADLVLGGTFANLPFAQGASLPRRALQFDPASGLFGLIPARKGGILADPEARQLLSVAIDREALIAALAVPGLVPRATVLEPGLDNVADAVAPAWAATPVAERQAGLVATARRIFTEDNRKLRIALPEGPGADILLQRLSQDWGALGIEVERSTEGEPADLRLVDEVAPSSSASWFLRPFRCQIAPVCDEQVDQLLGGAQMTPVLDQRRALLAQASGRIDAQQLFIPIAAPIRWSLVSPRISGFAGNRFAIHTLTGLEKVLNRTGE